MDTDIYEAIGTIIRGTDKCESQEELPETSDLDPERERLVVSDSEREPRHWMGPATSTPARSGRFSDLICFSPMGEEVSQIKRQTSVGLDYSSFQRFIHTPTEQDSEAAKYNIDTHQRPLFHIGRSYESPPFGLAKVSVYVV